PTERRDDGPVPREASTTAGFLSHTSCLDLRAFREQCGEEVREVPDLHAVMRDPAPQLRFGHCMVARDAVEQHPASDGVVTKDQPGHVSGPGSRGLELVVKPEYRASEHLLGNRHTVLIERHDLDVDVEDLARVTSEGF